LVTVLTLATSTPAVADEPDFAAIGAYVEAQRVAEHIPGMAVAIVGGDGTVYVAGFGAADATGRAVASNTPFILGSTSKSFTALAVMQLVEAGRIDLDAPVQRYLPWFRVGDAQASAAITVRELLNQTSGLSTAAGRATLMDFSRGDDALENRVRGLKNVALTAPVGTTYQYSNCNYQTLGLIVQQVSGQDFEAYMAEHVFAPLAMTRTYTSKEAAAANGLASGHRTWFDRSLPFDEPVPRGSVPQGFIISTAQDIAHYLSAQLNGGRYRDASVLSPAGMTQLHNGTARIGGSDVYYAMGWNAGTLDGRGAVWHAGDTFGFQSFFIVMTDAQWGVAVMSNTNDIPSNRRFEEIAFGVASLVVGGTPKTEHVHDAAMLYAIFLGIVVLQLAGMARTIALLHRWRRDPASRPRSAPATVSRIALPSTLNLLWAAFVFVVLPGMFASVRTLTWAVPDIGYLLLTSGAIALVWSAVRLLLIRRLAREAVPVS
jgi:CubicO group peptidase (beta-lactamase class C family)